METTERYIFLTCQDLLSIRFDRLGQTCTKAFVFLTDTDDSLPTALVKSVQGMGKKLRWIAVPDETNYLQAMYFELGKQHQKTSSEIPFAIIGKDPAYVSMYKFLIEQNRPAKLILGSTSETFETSDDELGNHEAWFDITLDDLSQEESIEEHHQETIVSAAFETETTNNDPVIQNGYPKSEAAYEAIRESASILVAEESIFNEVAGEVIRQMMHSGNRPSSRTFLRQYIHFQQHGLIDTHKIDDVIAAMIEHGDIFIDGDDVRYAF